LAVRSHSQGFQQFLEVRPAAGAGTGEHCVSGRNKHKLEEGIFHMRPKKVILCVDDNEQELSVLKFMLSTNGYRVLAATTAQEAVAMFSEALQIDLVLVDATLPQTSGKLLVERLKRIASHVPMILMGDPQTMGGDIHMADAMLAKKNCTAQELLERVKVMSARKRGPRKGTHRVQPVEQLAAVS
jgi:two-component system, OmpR family, response regulator CpxR